MTIIRDLFDPVFNERLPLRARILDRLIIAMVLTDEVLGELQTEEANPMLWIEPHVQVIFSTIDELVTTLAD